MGKLKSFRELKVYQKLKELHVEVHRESLRFPKFKTKDKTYLTEERFHDLDSRYDECGRMLEALHQSLSAWKGTTRTGKVVREQPAAYDSQVSSLDWDAAIDITVQSEGSFR